MQDKDYNFIFESGRRDFFAPAIALFLTIIIHLLLYGLFPKQFVRSNSKSDLEELKLEIVPPKPRKGAPEFIEANPYANQDTPRPNAPESFQNQRAADELPDPDSKSKLPYVGGEIKDGKKIVQGTSSPEDILNPQAVQSVLERPLVQQAHPAESPLSVPPQAAAETEKSKTPSPDGNAAGKDAAQKDSETLANSNLKDGERDSALNTGEPSEAESSEDGFLNTRVGGKAAQKSTAPESAKPDYGKKAMPSETGPKPGAGKALNSPASVSPKADNKRAEQPKEELPSPKPRPTLSMKIPAGPLADNRQRASSQGVLAVDSRFSEFGAYQQRMIEAISRQWNLLGSKYDLGAAVGSQIVIEFSLNMMGELVKCEVLFSNSTHTGAGLCEQAILTTAPYGAWTAEMINSLGPQDQSVRITFHYR